MASAVLHRHEAMHPVPDRRGKRTVEGKRAVNREAKATEGWERDREMR